MNLPNVIQRPGKLKKINKDGKKEKQRDYQRKNKNKQKLERVKIE